MFGRIAKAFVASVLVVACTSPMPPRSAPMIAGPIPGGALAQNCKGRDGWSDPAHGALLVGNTYYVGTCGITVLLIATPDGYVLIDGGLREAADSVLANIWQVGAEPHRIKWILSSHEHYDHTEALAYLKASTGAKLAALTDAAKVYESGKPNPSDPQFGMLTDMPPVKVDRIMQDGETIELGGLTITAHATPAHSPGSTSWTWRSCEPSGCQQIAYADSSSTISKAGYRFSKNPQRIAEIERGLATIAALPCDVLITPHPSASALFERLSGAAPLAASRACKAYAAEAQTRFAARLAREAAGTEP